jgi:acid phosphatase (class A)
MRRTILWAASGSLGFVAFVACASGAPAGYLPGALEPDIRAILPPAPKDGSPLDAADKAIFSSTRALAGSPRWLLAKKDVDSSIGAMLGDFSCALGVALTEKDLPALSGLLRKIGPNVAGAVNPAKDFYQRKRPYLVVEGPICVPRSEALDNNFDYPSGHATWGWTVGLILAELAPDRAALILSRARAFGESRVVCGVHNASAVEAGRTAASSLNAAMNGDAAFRNDLEAARAELAAVRKAAAKPQACKAEEFLTARTPW